MGDEGWMRAGLTLSEEVALEAARRAVPRLHRHDLEARLDSALVDLAHCRSLLNQAMRRVAELELQQITAQPAERHRRWAAELLRRWRG